MGPDNYQITGDLAGATSRFVERHYAGADKVRGDAGPRMRLRPEEKSADVVAVWTSGAAGDQNPVSTASGDDFYIADALGKVLGEEVVRVAGGQDVARGAAPRRTAGRHVSRPAGRRRTPPARRLQVHRRRAGQHPPRRCSRSAMSPLAGVSGEVLNPIYQHLRKQSPVARTVMITHANGSSGYIPDDAGFEQIGYEVTTSRLSPAARRTPS